LDDDDDAAAARNAAIAAAAWCCTVDVVVHVPTSPLVGVSLAAFTPILITSTPFLGTTPLSGSVDCVPSIFFSLFPAHMIYYID